ncbi:MAG: hypothetical protein ACR2M8_03970 [Pyrinomonadaceae bacterium]|nr:hypothetical protein [Acidobacteriota bacterium]MDQ3490906.1 hypothetical protein [Acidobacteriota bacterium]
MMAKTQTIGETSSLARRLALAVLGGLLTVVLISLLSHGLFPFLEFTIAAAVVYFIARR